jgi:hypothetical protein
VVLKQDALLCWPSSPPPRYDPAGVRGKVAAQGRKVARMPRCYGYREKATLTAAAAMMWRTHDGERMLWGGHGESGIVGDSD